MAQLYQVIDQSDNRSEDVQTLYPNIVENQHQQVRYVQINQTEDQQIQQPIIVTSNEQYMLLDNDPSIAFQNPQFGIQQSQQIYWTMESDENGQNIETISQPLVLNHALPPAQILNQGTQKVIMVQQAHPTMIVQQPPQLVSRQLPQIQAMQQKQVIQTSQIAQRVANTHGLVRATTSGIIRQQVRNMSPRTPQIKPIFENTGQLKGGMPNRNIAQIRSPIRAGTLPTNIRTPVQVPNRAITPNVRPILKGRTNIHGRPGINSQPSENNKTVEAVALEDGRVISVAEYQKILQERKRMEGRGLVKPGIPRPGANLLQQNSHFQKPQQLQQNPTMPVNPTTKPQIANIIRSQNQDSQRLPAVLRNFVPPPEIKDIISKTPHTAEFQNSIRMFVLLANGEQRLITFTLPKEECTIQDILEQVGVPVQSDTKIAVAETNTDGINLVVTVGISDDEENENIESEDSKSQNSQDGMKPSTPELVAPEPEEPKYIPGKLAVCSYCGFLSDDFNKCMRCQRKLPEGIKSFSTANVSRNKSGIDPKQNKIAINLKNNGLSPRMQPKRKPKPKLSEQEPVILMLSSDEEGGEDEENKQSNISSEEKRSDSFFKEPSVSDIKNSGNGIKGSIREEYDGIMSSIFCRTIRIGSYRFTPTGTVIINNKGLIIKTPSPNDSKDIKTINIDHKMVIKVLINFQKIMPVIFYYVSPAMAEIICKELGMVAGSEPYFHPLSLHEAYKRITLLPDVITEEARSVLKKVYGPPYDIIEELSPKEANLILVKTCSKETRSNSNLSNPLLNSATKVRQLLIYPPGRGGIAINTEDYLCLAQDQFLNDVIIDFYLKFLMNSLPEDQKEKVHVFSTFFYKRLTTKPTKPTRRSHPAELDPNLSAAEKRHTRVKSWTKNVNLFEKDFIIIPLNENAHWFLAIICFPNMDGPHTFDGKPYKIEPTEKKKKENVPVTNIGNVSITPVKTEKQEQIACEDGDLSDKDEADGDESELESGGESEEPATPPIASPTKQNRPPIRQPCILIFDSLGGTSRSRVIATLRDYLTCEYKAKMQSIKVFTKDVIRGACPKVPQQTNYTDCGLYLLQYVESFLKNSVKDYYIPMNCLKTWFEEITVTKKREDISNLIKELMINYKKDIEMLPSIPLPTLNGELIENSNEEEEEEDYHPEEEEEELENEKEATELENADQNLNEMETEMESETLKPSSECTSESFIEEGLNDTIIKPDMNEVPNVTSTDTMHYLKSKRINRHKQTEVINKKFKSFND